MDHKKIIKKAKEYFDSESPVCDLGGCEFHGQEICSRVRVWADSMDMARYFYGEEDV
jgi:hypothetical protein